MKRFSNFIARRYLRGHGKMPVSFSNLLSLIGIALGVFSLLVVLSVMNGFDSDIKERIIAFQSDVKIARADGKPLAEYEQILNRLESLPYVEHATPVVNSELLIQSEDGIFGSICNGIDYDSYSASTNLRENVIIGHPDSESLQDDGIIIGFDLAVNLNITTRDKIQLSSPLGTEVTPFGLLPRSRSFTVIGLFSSGIPDYDAHYVYCSLEAAQYFNGISDAAELIEVRTENPHKSAYYRRLLAKELGDNYRVEDWSDYEANLFNAFKMEKVLMVIVLSLIILLAGFNMAGNLNRLVTEKTQDIGIFQAFGVNDKAIKSIFMNTSLFIGISGIICGLAAAVLFLWAQIKWNFIKIPVTGLPIDELPLKIVFSDFIAIPLLALAIILLSALIPAAKSKTLSTVDIIRK